MSSILILLVLVAGVVLTYVLCYNGLVNHRFRVDEAWSGITVQLKRRHALVPNLVDAARTAMAYESAILDRIVEARSQALEALATGEPEAIRQAEAGLGAALGRFTAYTEDNPEIAATESISLLQKQLEETEDQIAAARRLYNGNVQVYNTKVKSIPWTFVANLNRFEPSSMFEVDAAEAKRIAADPSVSALGLDAGTKTGITGSDGRS